MTWFLCYKAGTGRAIAHPLGFATEQEAQAFADRHEWGHLHPVESDS